MSKTSVHVIPLLKNLCWLPIAYTREQSNLMALASVVLRKRAFPALPGHFSLFCASPDSLNTRFSSSSITSALVFACNAFLHLACHGRFYSVLQGSAHMLPPLWASFTRGINLHPRSTLCVPCPSSYPIVYFFFLAAQHGILVPRPGMEPRPLQWKLGALITGPPGKSLSHRILTLCWGRLSSLQAHEFLNGSTHILPTFVFSAL